MKNEIIRLGCGLDIGKDKFDACFGAGAKDGSFVVKATKKFDNTKSGINAFLKWLDQNHAKHDPVGRAAVPSRPGDDRGLSRERVQQPV